MHTFTIQSEYTFDDLVEYDAPHAKGRGRIMDIVLAHDRQVYYIILDDNGDGIGGIYPEHMRLLTPANKGQ